MTKEAKEHKKIVDEINGEFRKLDKVKNQLGQGSLKIRGFESSWVAKKTSRVHYPKAPANDVS